MPELYGSGIDSASGVRQEARSQAGAALAGFLGSRDHGSDNCNLAWEPAEGAIVLFVRFKDLPVAIGAGRQIIDASRQVAGKSETELFNLTALTSIQRRDSSLADHAGLNWVRRVGGRKEVPCRRRRRTEAAGVLSPVGHEHRFATA